MKALGLIPALLFIVLTSYSQPCQKPKEPKLFVEGRELPVTNFKTYTLNLCEGQTKTVTFAPQEGSYRYYIGKSTGELLLDNVLFNAGAAAFTQVAFNQAVAGSYTVYVFEGSGSGADPPPCASDPFTLVIEKSFFGPSLNLLYSGSRDTCANSLLQITAAGSQGNIQWFKNGVPDGTGNNYSFSIQSDTRISATLTPAETCALPNTPVTASIEFTVTQPFTPYVSISKTEPSVRNCEGESVTFFREAERDQGNYPTYQWLVNGLVQQGKTDPLDFTLENWPNGTEVALQLKRNDGCTAQNTISSNVIRLLGNASNSSTVNILEIKTNVSSQPVCSGTVVTLAPVTNRNGLRYAWTSPGLYLADSVYRDTVFETTVYKVSAFISGCFSGSDTDSLEIKVADTTRISIKEKNPSGNEFSLCGGSPVTFTAVTGSGSKLFAWYLNKGRLANSDSAISFTSLADGDVIRVETVPGSSSCSLVSSDSLIIKIVAKPREGFTSGSSLVYFCKGSGILLSPEDTADTFSYQWLKDGNNLSNPLSTYYASQPGIYQVNIRTGTCSTISVIEVKEFPLEVKANATPLRFRTGEEVRLSADLTNPTDEMVTFNWEPSDIIPLSGLQNTTAYPLQAGIVTITVVSGQGCMAKDSITLIKADDNPQDTTIVNPNPSPDTLIDTGPLSYPLFIPNALTPSTSDQNAWWNITGSENFPALEVTVFNRWGEQVFNHKGFYAAWDGTINGKNLPTGTYYYLISDQSFSKPLVGDLTILR